MSRTIFLIGVFFIATSLRADETPPKTWAARDIDALIAKDLKLKSPVKLNDESFLRRASFDLIGRPATPDELDAFLKDAAADKRARLIDRLLASPDFGKHWANHWTNTISAQVPPPELTFLNYTYLQNWLADKLNKGVSWDAIVSDILTAKGAVKDNPAATFIGYHQGRPAKLAAETARIFLGLQVQCAECHDHKFENWKRTDFHSLAAFFVRSTGKLNSLDGAGTMVADAGKGEWNMPDVVNPQKKGATIFPAFLTGEKIKPDLDGAERRQELARWLANAKNPWFAKAFVNRVWARTMGRGFFEPVDSMAESTIPDLPEVHGALAESFVASKFDIKAVYRLIMNTEAYQYERTLGEILAPKGATTHAKLDGDAIFRSLEQAIGLPNIKSAPGKATSAVRFPPPPKTTRDIVAVQFCFDPSLRPEEVSRTMGQAMLLMNNPQIQTQIDADPKSGTRLSKLLTQETDNRKAVAMLFQQVYGRNPSNQEATIALDYINEVGTRHEAFEDILWSLVNSAEFTTKR